MNHYIASSAFGLTLFAAKTLASAKKKAVKEIGTYAFESIRKATGDDVAWVRQMGGYVPNLDETNASRA